MARPDEISAGGVVVRGEELIVVVPVKRAADGQRVLGLPKGHPEGDETLEQAALREVREETGVVADLADPLGAVTYHYERQGRRRLKQVSFWLMHYRSGSTDDHDHEMEDVRWMDFDAALEALTYPGERDIVGRARALVRGPDGV